MRFFLILAVFVIAFGGAAMLYEQESRKVKGVLEQVTELQAQMGDLQAEVNRLRGELQAVKLTQQRRLQLNGELARERQARLGAVEGAEALEGAEDTVRQRPQGPKGRILAASDVTSAAPVIRPGGEEDPEWSRPTVDAEEYRRKVPQEASAPVTAHP
ncbi:hypothetical protein Maes01_02652 [Microbulbifer aestuariivivens]|uniref:DUF1043 family protein n=1 Tax=Microbulbifer aestuariivivens TaxID=1908308 RepID=A0ABP9WTY2_9GAMM